MAAVNCKGFMDIRGTPDSIRAWAVKQNTQPGVRRLRFTDGSKMNIEQNVLCNASGLLPASCGMIGVKTDLKNAVKDFVATGQLRRPGIVDYTLGGDFGGGVFVIGRAVEAHLEWCSPTLKYLKMGDGPDYLFYRPYHLCHIETPLSAAEAVIFQEPTIAPVGKPVAQTITLAKRDLKAGEVLDSRHWRLQSIRRGRCSRQYTRVATAGIGTRRAAQARCEAGPAHTGGRGGVG